MAGPASYAEAVGGGKPSDTRKFSSLEKPRCFTCRKEEGTIPLKCKKHKLCMSCLKENCGTYGPEKMDTCPSAECAHPGSSPPIWIYVDNSNIWIGAKKLASKVKGFQSSKDHRVRINIGNLTDVVSKSRDVKTGTLYGSEPPQIDSVWDKIREHKHWTVKTKKKSYLTHKEKEVDAQLLVDVTEVACTTPVSERSTIVLITGDADMCPAVEKIMEYDGWKVEIYTWQDSLSRRLKTLSKRNENVICEPLDNHMTEVVFTNNKFPVSQYEIPKDCSAVLTMEPGCFPKRVIDSEWWNKLESIAQWPVQYLWIIKDDEETDDMLLVFSNTGEKVKYNVSHLVQVVNDNNKDCGSDSEPLLPHVQKAETYIDYEKRLRNFATAVIQYGRFKIADVGSRDSNYVLRKKAGSADIVKSPAFRREVHVVDVNPTSLNASDPSEKFKSVPPTKVGGKPKECYLGKNCILGCKCEFPHSESDKIFFEANRGKGMPNRKTQLCKKFPSCHKDPSKCNYAHGDGDGWCLTCRRHGHFMKACPRKDEWTE